MAEQEKKRKEPLPPLSAWAPAVAIAWLIPGGGHIYLGKRGRGFLLLFSVVSMFVLGLTTRGAFFQPQTGDLLTTIIYCGGFLGNMLAGIPYFLSVWMGYSQGDVPGLVHDYGTKFLVGAGLLNVLAMVDAFEIAVGEKRLMLKMTISHLEAAALFAFFTSIVLGVVTKRTDRDRLHYGLYCFGYFLVALFGLGWLMYFGHR